MDTLDIRLAAVEYALSLVSAELAQAQPGWSERIKGCCDAAALDYVARMALAGNPQGEDAEMFMSAIMQNFLSVR
ncbi:MAG: hypothetical protein Pyrs2KO_26620 [Pyruvatibacter sp.]